MTAQNAFSGNLAPALEAEHEARTSFTLARMGLYKQALVSLRSVLELGLLSVYWDAHDQAHLDIQRWRAGMERSPGLGTVERRLREVRGVAIYLESDPALLDHVRRLSDDLGAYVHTRGHRSSSAGLVPLTNIASFHAEAFDLWVQRLTEAVQFVLAIHLMKYPVGLQVTPLSEKFGLNPPAGGLVEPHLREMYRAFLEPQMRDRLQSLSDGDAEAVGVRDWVESLPTLSDEDWRHELLKHDRQSIESGGYEMWARHRDSVDEHLEGRLTDAERQERQAYREDLRQWAEQEGLATLEDVIARQRARIAEQSAEDR
jgi:hypothetical protein